MSTYAHYRIWIGILKKGVEKLPLAAQEFFMEIEASDTGVAHGGFLFERILMHGETIGFGIEMKDLDWITADEEPEEVDRFFYFRHLGEELLRAQTLFQLTDVAYLPFKIYHHIDLGD